MSRRLLIYRRQQYEWLWIALLFVSGFGVVTTTVYTKLDEAISDAVKTGKITQEEANAAYK